MLVDILGKVIIRIAVAAFGTALALAFVVLSAIGGGGGKGALTASVLIALFMGAWALLPLIRWSQVFGALFALAWVICAYFLSRFGHEDKQGWMLGPWALATMGIVVCLCARPPEYFSRSRGNEGEQPSTVPLIGVAIEDSREEATDALPKKIAS